MSKAQAIKENISMNDHRIRAYTSEKLRAHTATELVEVSKRLFDRSRLEIALTNKLDEALKELEKNAASDKEKLDEMDMLTGLSKPKRKSEIASMVSNIFNR
jgi:hypothetical protein